MSDPSENRSIFERDGEHILPGGLTRGPWDANAQHGGAPAALIAQSAIAALDDDGFVLLRQTVELPRPVPIAPLTLEQQVEAGRSIARVHSTLRGKGKVVAQAVTLFGKAVALNAEPAQASESRLPPPADCADTGHWFAGMDTRIERFHHDTMETRLAAGVVAAPGPAAVWFRLRHPLFPGTPAAPAALAAAVSDFGNGISWALPYADYLFINADVTLQLHRAPVGEWVGLDSRTRIEPTGLGCAYGTLHDERGPIGAAQQSLLIRKRGD